LLCKKRNKGVEATENVLCTFITAGAFNSTKPFPDGTNKTIHFQKFDHIVKKNWKVIYFSNLYLFTSTLTKIVALAKEIVVIINLNKFPILFALLKPLHNFKYPVISAFPSAL